MWARKDGKLKRSVISQKKAAETKGATNTTPSPQALKGAHDTTYDSQSFVTLRYSKLGTQRTFEETFFIVRECQPDVILRHNIEKESLNSEPGCYPNFYKGTSRGKKSQSRSGCEQAVNTDTLGPKRNKTKRQRNRWKGKAGKTS